VLLLLTAAGLAGACGFRDVPSSSNNGLFAGCCGTRGKCVPSASVPSGAVEQLGQDTCGDALLCAPQELIEPDYAPPVCRSIGAAEGRCLSECLPDVQKRGDRIPQSTCDAGSRCVPCFDPLTGDDTGACNLASDTGPTEPPKRFADCCSGVSRCVPSTLVDSDDRSRLSRDTCKDREALCVPEALAKDPSSFVPDTCKSLGGLEGRCLPACLPELAPDVDRLPTAGCPKEHVCAPCSDPWTGEPTGACKLGADPGPSRKSARFASCCGELGRCLPRDLVARDDRERFATDSCSDEQALCVPERWARDPDYVPTSCRSLGDREGRCLPECLPDVQKRGDELQRGSCDENERCVPCFDPLTGDDTGACKIGADAEPSEPSKPFASCCEEQSRCLPTELVPDETRSRFNADGCDEENTLCVPQAFVSDPNFTPASCRSLLDLEGRCLPACLPEVAAQSARLPQSTCDDGQLCAPCFDPISGALTGACGLGQDAGPRESPVRLPSCCRGVGSCVPVEWVPDDVRARMARDTCGSEQELCVPEPWSRDPRYVPSTCSSLGDTEGRCLPACLPEIAGQASKLPQSSCPAEYVCAPCFDPLDGTATGACSLSDDPGPGGTAQTPATCCGGVGRCLDGALVPQAQRGRLDRNSCASSAELCVPADWARDENAVAASCRSLIGAEGRCLPACLPELAALSGRLPKSTCPDAHVCAPCYDPLDGTDTGACKQRNDPGPQEPPKLFDRCCGTGSQALGACVPSSLLGKDEASRLPAGMCAQRDQVCAPITMAKPKPERLPSCRAPGSLDEDSGACMPDCFLSAINSALLSRSSCRSGEQCVPCSELGNAPGGCR
jgi:hypothetical protein